ncbi:hypothetical protein K523DRAFT_160418 [Schizophyllum commune Tattone D]|nr:hypothetical protein K523DRAFT_160418 [Schizophyllum commune Tattone D]
MNVTTCPMIIGHLVATIPTKYKTITTMICCNICCNKSLWIQLPYRPAGHCRAGHSCRRRCQNPAAAVRDALVVVAPPPAPRRTPHVLPAAPSDPSHAPSRLTAAVPTRAYTVFSRPPRYADGRTLILAAARASTTFETTASENAAIASSRARRRSCHRTSQRSRPAVAHARQPGSRLLTRAQATRTIKLRSFGECRRTILAPREAMGRAPARAVTPHPTHSGQSATVIHSCASNGHLRR